MTSKEVLDLLIKNGLTIAFAESMTGGLLAYELVKNEGASNAFLSSVVSYSINEKINRLNILQSDIDQYGVVSLEISKAMAKSIKLLTNANVSVGITGYASKTISKDITNHEAFVTIVINDYLESINIDFDNLNRLEAIQYSVKIIYEKLYKLLKKL